VAARTDVTEPDGDELGELQVFVVQLGAAMNAAGEPVYAVQERLAKIAAAYGAQAATVSAFPTYLMVTMGRGAPAAVEVTTPLASSPRLDQIAALERLLQDAERGAVRPTDGLRRLAEIRQLHPRFGPLQSIAGYSVLTMGLCLILQPAPLDVAAAAVFGALVGLLRSFARSQPTLQVLMPVIAAFSVSALSALAVEEELLEPGLRAMVASLVVFLPGAALTTAVLELAAGQMVSGSSRLVSGGVQLALLSFGILAGIEAVGIPSSLVLFGRADLLGAWSPWLGVVVFAVGVTVAHSAPTKTFPGLLVVLYAAWTGQVLGNAVFGGYVSALVGATVMTIVAVFISRFPAAMPAHASFLPGFWLLVPGALGLIGLTELASGGGGQDLVATVGSIFAVALGVLCGTQIVAWGMVTGRVVTDVSGSVAERRPRLKRRRARTNARASSRPGDEPSE
jgi:uncharacterized membrane protein YjjP (DUF1212 family)